MRGLVFLLPAVPLLCGAWCGEPCFSSEKTVYGLVVEGGEVIVSEGQGGFHLGDLSDTPVSECRHIAGGLHVVGEVPGPLSAFDGIETIGGHLWFMDALPHSDDPPMTPIKDVSGFPRLRSVNELLVEGPVHSISGLGALEEVTQWMRFPGPPGEVTGLGALRFVRELHIWETGLPSLGFLRSLEVVGQDLEIVRNHRLRGVELPALVEVQRDLWIGSNDELESVAGMTSLTRVGGDLTIGANPSLPSEEALAWAADVEVEGEVVICVNQGGTAEDPCPPSGGPSD